MDYLDKLTKLRADADLSIGKLTELAGLSPNTIYNWYKEGRKVQPTVYALKAVCDVLGISLSSFFAIDNKEYLSAQEEQLLTAFSKVDEKYREHILIILEGLAADKGEEPTLQAD